MQNAGQVHISSQQFANQPQLFTTLPGAPAHTGGMRIPALILFALLAASARAELVPIGETEAAFNFIDAKAIEKSDHMRRVWLVLDLKQKKASGAASVRALYDFDCEASRFTQLASLEFSDAGGAGALLRTQSRIKRWASIGPESAAEGVRRYVCTQ